MRSDNAFRYLLKILRWIGNRFPAYYPLIIATTTYNAIIAPPIEFRLCLWAIVFAATLVVVKGLLEKLR
jgi:hypothetical protein